MILEGIVTTLESDGALHIAPMGPQVEPGMGRFVLRPFKTSQTYANLKRHGEGVLHITDDVWLLAQAAVGLVKPPPRTMPAKSVRGEILCDACRYYEFRIVAADETSERASLHAEVLASGRLRDFFGFNRAKHAVLEAAILATRLSFLPRAEVQSDFKRLGIIVDKTGGEQEKNAFAFLRDYLSRHVATKEHSA